jgi:L-lactate dehydrogenase complex protein LldG
MTEKDFQEIVDEYLAALWDASTDDHLRLALSRAVERFRQNREAAFNLYPWITEKAKQLREIKDYSLLHMDELSKEVKDRVEDLHGNCIIAKTVDEAMEYIGDQVKSGDVVVKAKSITSEVMFMKQILVSLSSRNWAQSQCTYSLPLYMSHGSRSLISSLVLWVENSLRISPKW